MTENETLLTRLADHSGYQPLSWHARCYEFACHLRNLINGDDGLRKLYGEVRAVYGHWTGPVDPDGFWSHKADFGFIRHGWVLLDDGSVIDPTRWSFENVKPYVYIGENDHYDEGGDELREAMWTGKPWPKTEEGEETFWVDFPLEARHHLMTLAEDAISDGITFAQAMWIANCPFRLLDPFAKVVFQALEDADLKALIPIDNYERAMA